MSAGPDIFALYREFTDALTEVLAELRATRRGAVDLQGHALWSKGMPSTASMNIF